ncbi:uncharacterized protein LOC117098301 isoform X2 [Trachypithecus francoisi]|uniref:uncharacterized protein LOC117098301 isoform X2 n=1 Tax=Trachypithecus francoisi TaxID=54180 RepID=UPI00141AF65D|nr:uncharacterized protein LOC117098301 isoform X2 [Trachypithecus francoisi]
MATTVRGDGCDACADLDPKFPPAGIWTRIHLLPIFRCRWRESLRSPGQPACTEEMPPQRMAGIQISKNIGLGETPPPMSSQLIIDLCQLPIFPLPVCLSRNINKPLLI